MPGIVNVVDKDGWSLLALLCRHIDTRNGRSYFPVFHYLIEQNPSSLLWNFGDLQLTHTSSMDIDGVATGTVCRTVGYISNSRFLSILVPWICQKYPWVLDPSSSSLDWTKGIALKEKIEYDPTHPIEFSENDDDQDDEVKQLILKPLNDLTEKILDFNDIDDDEKPAASGELVNHIVEVVSQTPRLTLFVAPSDNNVGLTIAMAVTMTHLCRYAGQDILKFLIAVNPHVLTYEWDYEEDEDDAPMEDHRCSVLRNIAGYSSQNTLLPWIAEKYAWVLDHPNVLLNPAPHLEIVREYVKGDVPPSLLRKFYELYPAGLRQRGGYDDENSDTIRSLTPLRMCLYRLHEVGKWTDRDSELLRWMVQEYPEAASYQDHQLMGMTGLAEAALYYLHAYYNSEEEERQSAEVDGGSMICRILIEARPEMIRVADSEGKPPLYHMLHASRVPSVHDLTVWIARQGYWERGQFQFLDETKYMRKLQSLLEEEESLDNQILFFKQTKGQLFQLAEDAKGRIEAVDKVSEIFASWSSEHLENLEKEKEKLFDFTVSPLSFISNEYLFPGEGGMMEEDDSSDSSDDDYPSDEDDMDDSSDDDVRIEIIDL